MSLASIITSVACTPIDSPRRAEHDASQTSQAAQEASSEHLDAALSADEPASRDAGMRMHSADAGHMSEPRKQKDAGAHAADGGQTQRPRDAGAAAGSGSAEDAGPSDEDAGSGHATLTRTGYARANELSLFRLQTLSSTRTNTMTRSRASIMRNRH